MQNDAELLELLLDFVHCSEARIKEWREFLDANGSKELKEYMNHAK